MLGLFLKSLNGQNEERALGGGYGICRTGGLEPPFCVWGSADALVLVLEWSARPTHREKGTCQRRQSWTLKAFDGSRGGAR